jgi:hypothetical protein
MTVRTPLRLTSSNHLIEFSASEITQGVNEAIRQHGINPMNVLSIVSSGGNLGTISDTRLQAGASTTDVTNFDTAAETPNVSTVTVNYAKITRTTASDPGDWSDSTYSYPLYYDGSDLREMTPDDFDDTFIEPAITSLVLGSTTTAQAGTYQASTSTSVSGNTLISSTPFFTDTRANAGAYTSGGIGETLDQPTTINNYYLHRIDAGAKGTISLPFCYRKADNDLQVMPEATFSALLQQQIRTNTRSVAGNRIRYSLDTTSTLARGSTIVDTKLNSSTYTTRYVNTNDYRTQEFPSGSAATVSNYYLRIRRT